MTPQTAARETPSTSLATSELCPKLRLATQPSAELVTLSLRFKATPACNSFALGRPVQRKQRIVVQEQQ